jgi:hypothetical protein
MPNFAFDSDFVVETGVDEVTLHSTDEALDFVRRMEKQSPDPRWDALRRKLDAVKTQEDANEAAGALREVLAAEGLFGAQVTRVSG